MRPHVVLIAAALAACSPPQRLQKGNLSDFARFGRSAAISGQTLAIGAREETGSVQGEGAVYVYTASGNAWNLQVRLKASDPADAQFGDKVAISNAGDTIAVGAPMADQPGALRAGAVYIFQRSGTTWTEQAKLAPPTPELYQAFGDSVALDGDLLVVGSDARDQGSAVNAGAAYVFRRTGATWAAPVALAGPSPASQDGYGSSVAVAGDAVFVGALRRDVGGAVDTGAVYAYAPSGASWVLGQTLLASDLQADDLFGSSLAISVNGGTRRLVVGATNADLPGPILNAGAAYVFTSMGGGSFTQTQKLVAGDPAAGAIFAYSVSIFEDRILVGAPGATVSSLRSGAAYLFDFAGSTWSQAAKLAPATSTLDDNLGGAVAVAASWAFAGATEEDVAPGLTSAGTVHAYREVSPGTWLASQRLAASNGTPDDGFGRFSLSVSTDTLVVGSRFQVDVLRRDADAWSLVQQLAPPTGLVSAVATAGDRLAFFRLTGASTPIGRVEVYLRAANGVWALEQELVPDLVSPTQQGESANAAGLALQGSRLVVGAHRWNGGDGRVFVYERSGSTWSQVQLLESAIASTNFDMNFGEDVALDGNTLVVSEVPSEGLHDPTHPRIGKVHVFALSGGAFGLVQTLTAPSPLDLDHFGTSIALAGDLLAIVGEASGGGRMVRTYRRTAGVFTQTWSTPVAELGASGDGALAFDGDRLALGVPGASFSGLTGAGEVRVYFRQPNDTWTLGPTERARDAINDQGLGFTLTFVAGHLVAGDSIPGVPGSAYAFEL